MYAVLQFPNLYCLNNWPKSHYIWKICEFNYLYWAIAITFCSLLIIFFDQKRDILTPKFPFYPILHCAAAAVRLLSGSGAALGDLVRALVSWTDTSYLLVKDTFRLPVPSAHLWFFCFIRTPLTLLNFSNKHDLSCLHPKQATRPVKTPWKKCVEKSESCQTVNCTTCLPLELWKQKPRHWQTPRAHFLSKDTSTGDFRDRLKQNHNLVLNNS